MVSKWPLILYSTSHLYVTVPPNVVLVLFKKKPFTGESGLPQSEIRDNSLCIIHMSHMISKQETFKTKFSVFSIISILDLEQKTVLNDILYHFFHSYMNLKYNSNQKINLKNANIFS